MSEQKWVRKSLTVISNALKEYEYQISRTTTRRLLKQLKYGLFGNRKSLAPSHPDREKQFDFINETRKEFRAENRPIISVDMKKKELIGSFKNAGRAWSNGPTPVNIHDFKSDSDGKAAPYGIYDTTHNQGYVYVGTSFDTPTFAAHAIAQWWQDPDRPHFALEDKLLILCDGGGSNSYRYWQWKIQLQKQLADQFGIEVVVCHYPKGASKWNPIEHRLFSEISKNWAGKPLYTFQTVLNYIRGTTTSTGLSVKAFLVEKIFEKGLGYELKDRQNLNMHREKICPNWNYTIKPSSYP